MKIQPVLFSRPAAWAAACLLALPVVSRAENPLAGLGDRIKDGVSNVGSAIKKTAKAAKNIVTPGKAEETKAPPPRATVVGAEPKTPRQTGDGGPAVKAKRPPAKVDKTSPEVVSKPKPKNTEANASTPASKSKTKAKPPEKERDRDSDGDKPKSRKKAVTDEREDSPGKKEKSSGEYPPEKEANPAAPEEAISEAGSNGETGPPPAEAKAPEDLPFGTPAFGRKGFVYSPYAPDQGLIDVNAVAAGTKVRCPYTGKVFRVP